MISKLTGNSSPSSFTYNVYNDVDWSSGGPKPVGASLGTVSAPDSTSAAKLAGPKFFNSPLKSAMAGGLWVTQGGKMFYLA